MRIFFFLLTILSFQTFVPLPSGALLLSSEPDNMTLALSDDWQEVKTKQPNLVFAASKRTASLALYRTSLRAFSQASDRMMEEFGNASARGFAFSKGVQQDVLSYDSKICYIFYTGPKNDSHFQAYILVGKKIYYFVSANVSQDRAKEFIDQAISSALKEKVEQAKREETVIFNPVTPEGLFFFTLQSNDVLAGGTTFDPRCLRLSGRENPEFYAAVSVAEPKLEGDFKEAMVARSQKIIAGNPSCKFWKLEQAKLRNNWEAYYLPYICVEGSKSLQRFAFFVKADNSLLVAESVGLDAATMTRVLGTGAANRNASLKLPQIPSYNLGKVPLSSLPRWGSSTVDTLTSGQLKLVLVAAIASLWIIIRLLFFGVRYLGVSATPSTGYPIYVDRLYSHLGMVFEARIQGNRYLAISPRPAVALITFALLINTVASVSIMMGHFRSDVGIELVKTAVRLGWWLIGIGAACSFIYPKRLRVLGKHNNRVFIVNRTGMLPVYALKNMEGKTVCIFKKGFSFPVKRWMLYDLKGNRLIYVKEKSVFKSLLRRVFGHLFGLLRSSYYIFDAQGRNIGEMKRSPSLGNSYFVNITDRQWLGEPVFLNTCALDEQVMMAFFLHLDTKAPDRIHPWYE
ncbi:MAG TPA: hypothetical protein PLL10_02175 [Elusimicrobiales bacterium]|nr:hypothetical protein [Elusimicrobiales bacterium]